MPIRRLLAASVGVLVLLTLIGLVLWWPAGDAVLEEARASTADRAHLNIWTNHNHVLGTGVATSTTPSLQDSLEKGAGTEAPPA